MQERDLVALSRLATRLEAGETVELRRRAGLSCQDIAAVCGVTQVTVWRWEKRQRRPRGAAALKYARLIEGLDRAA